MKVTTKKYLRDFRKRKVPPDFDQGIENTLLLDAFYGILQTFVKYRNIDEEKKGLLELIIKNEKLEVLSRKTLENRQYYDSLIECCKIILSLT